MFFRKGHYPVFCKTDYPLLKSQQNKNQTLKEKSFEVFFVINGAKTLKIVLLMLDKMLISLGR